jgi:transcriptional regulator with XRE-family HTH domain
MTQHTGPGIRRRVLAKALVRCREEAGLTFDDVVRNLSISKSKISRIEAALSGVSIVDTRALAGLYGVDPEVADRLELMARIAKQRGWWHVYHQGTVLVDWFADFVALESEAVGMDTFEIDVIPGLFQTRAYAQWITRVGLPTASDQFIADRVALRMARQRRLEGTGYTVWAILDEAALRRVVGGTDVHIEQLEHLVKLAELPNITLQVVPFAKGPHMSLGTAFSLLKFSQYPSVVYIDNLTGGLYADEKEDVERYTLVLDHLRATAVDPYESVSLVRRVISDLRAGS